MQDPEGDEQYMYMLSILRLRIVVVGYLQNTNVQQQEDPLADNDQPHRFALLTTTAFRLYIDSTQASTQTVRNE